MDLDFSTEELAFRDELRQFLANELPADIRGRIGRGDHGHVRDDITQWQKILHAKGWARPRGQWNSVVLAGAKHSNIFSKPNAPWLMLRHSSRSG